MVIYKWTQLNNLIEAGRATFAAIFDEKLRPSRVVLFVLDEKNYGCKFITKQFTSGLVADHNVFWINNSYNFC